MIKVLDAAPRPERLFSRIKINSVDENAPRLTIVRSPKGPDGTPGFHAISRLPRMSGKLFNNKYYLEIILIDLIFLQLF